jgi:hypothetical protein
LLWPLWLRLLQQLLLLLRCTWHACLRRLVNAQQLLHPPVLNECRLQLLHPLGLRARLRTQ